MQFLTENCLNRCQNFRQFDFLKTKNEPNFGFPYIPSSWHFVEIKYAISHLKPTKYHTVLLVVQKILKTVKCDWQTMDKLIDSTYFKFKTSFEVDITNVLTLHQLQLCFGVLWNIVFTLVLTILSHIWCKVYIHLNNQHKWSPISCRSSAWQGKFAGQTPAFCHNATQPNILRPSPHTDDTSHPSAKVVSAEPF